MWQNLKSQIVTKLKIKKKRDKTQKLQLWQNSKTQIMVSLKNSNCEKTQKHKLWQNSKTQIVTVTVTVVTKKFSHIKKKCP